MWHESVQQDIYEESGKEGDIGRQSARMLSPMLHWIMPCFPQKSAGLEGVQASRALLIVKAPFHSGEGTTQRKTKKYNFLCIYKIHLPGGTGKMTRACGLGH
jgi:hypothetical protein